MKVWESRLGDGGSLLSPYAPLRRGVIAGNPDYLGSDLSSCSNTIEKILRYITHHVTIPYFV